MPQPSQIPGDNLSQIHAKRSPPHDRPPDQPPYFCGPRRTLDPNLGKVALYP
jgi:hypothetical protein